MQTTTHEAEALAILRHELAAMSLRDLVKAHRAALERFSLAGTAEAAQRALDTAVEITHAHERRVRHGRA